MRILEVHEVNYFSKPIFEFIEIPEALSLRGHDVTVVDFGEGTKKVFSLKTRTFKARRVFPDSKAVVVRPGAVFFTEFLARFTNMISSFFVLRRLFREKHFDAVILYSVPTNGWQTVFLANRFGVPVFFRSLDVLYKLRPFPFPLKQIVRSLEKYVYRNSDYIFALTPRLGRYCGRKDFLPLYPAVNTDIFRPIPSSSPVLVKLRKKHGLRSSDKVIFFLGTFYDFGGLDIFIKNLSRIKKRIPDVKLLLAGGAGVESDLKRLVKDLGLEDDVIFAGWVPYAEVVDYINLCDVCINPFRECEATRHIIPAKLFQYTACRKPIVSRKLPGILDIIPDKGLGVVYAVSDRQLIDETIRLLEDKEWNERIADAGYRFTLKNHSWPFFISKLESYLKKYAGR